MLYQPGNFGCLDEQTLALTLELPGARGEAWLLLFAVLMRALGLSSGLELAASDVGTETACSLMVWKPEPSGEFTASPLCLQQTLPSADLSQQ